MEKPKVIDTIVQLNNYPKEKYNVLIPVTAMQVMSEMQRIIVNEVCLDTDVQRGGDIYYEKTSGKYAITKVGGMKLAAAANISILSSESVTPDVCIKCIDMVQATRQAQPCGNCAHAYDVKYVVNILVPEPSGRFRKIPEHKEIDCAMEKQVMTDAQYKRFLPHRAAIAESKALMRCIRTALGLKAGYTLDELKKPFIIAHVVPNLDAPEIRERLASGYLESMGLLFEGPAKPKQLAAGPANPPQQQESPAPDEPLNESEYPVEMDDTDDEGFPFDEPRHFCVDCGIEIVETQSSKGKTWSAEDVVNYSQRLFGRCLCPNCQRAANKGGRG